jgi:hypothetical protein
LGLASMSKILSKKVLSISLATIFGIAMIASPIGVDAMGSYLSIDKLKIDMTSEEIKKAEIKPDGKIPSTETSWYGYAVLTSHGDILAATTHTGFCDSEVQTDDSNSVPSLGADCSGDWHIHMVTLAENANCVTEDNANGLAVGRISYEENGELKVKKNKVEFKDASRDTLSLKNVVGIIEDQPENFELGEIDGVVASFVIRPVFDDVEDPDLGDLLGVCLDVQDALEATKTQLKS